MKGNTFDLHKTKDERHLQHITGNILNLRLLEHQCHIQKGKEEVYWVSQDILCFKKALETFNSPNPNEDILTVGESIFLKVYNLSFKNLVMGRYFRLKQSLVRHSPSKPLTT